MNDRLRVLQRQPRRISITLSYHVHEALLSRSEDEGRSVSNLCAFLLEDALREQPPFIQLQGFDGNGNGSTAPSKGIPPTTSHRSNPNYRRP